MKFDVKEFSGQFKSTSMKLVIHKVVQNESIYLRDLVHWVQIKKIKKRMRDKEFVKRLNNGVYLGKPKDILNAIKWLEKIGFLNIENDIVVTNKDFTPTGIKK